MKKRMMSCILMVVLIVGSLGIGTISVQAAATPKTAVTKVKKSLGKKYRCDLVYSKNQINRVFGLSGSDYSSAYGEGMNIIINVDNILVVKPKKGKTNTIKRALKAYKAMQLERPYPMNEEQLYDTRIETINGYVCYICLETKTLNNKAIKVLKKALK